VLLLPWLSLWWSRSSCGRALPWAGCPPASEAQVVKEVNLMLIDPPEEYEDVDDSSAPWRGHSQRHHTRCPTQQNSYTT